MGQEDEEQIILSLFVKGRTFCKTRQANAMQSGSRGGRSKEDGGWRMELFLKKPN